MPGSGLNGTPSSSRGFGHSTASATKETISTTAAAHANSHSGIGRLLRWTSPCADAAGGAISATAAGGARIQSLRIRRLERCLYRVLERLDAERALEPRGDLPVAPDNEQPRLRAQPERAQGRPKALVRVVADVDLLVDEVHAVAVLLLE